jgi:hypothetical protein
VAPRETSVAAPVRFSRWFAPVVGLPSYDLASPDHTRLFHHLQFTTRHECIVSADEIQQHLDRLSAKQFASPRKPRRKK